jgi:hypothetical protein
MASAFLANEGCAGCWPLGQAGAPAPADRWWHPTERAGFFSPRHGDARSANRLARTAKRSRQRRLLTGIHVRSSSASAGAEEESEEDDATTVTKFRTLDFRLRKGSLK